MAVIVTAHANTLAEAFTIVVLAGFIQAALGLARIGRFVAYTPYSVISGFMTGIGVIIMIVQIAPFLGSPVAVGGVIGAVNALQETFTSVNFHALAVAAVTLVVGILWPRPFRRFLPAPLAAMIVGCALGILWLNDLPVIGEVPTGLPDLQLPVFSVGFILGAMEPALVLALLGSIDSLLTSLIADSLTRTRHNPNRELIGQGIGNMIAGLIGGLPGAGATLGTVVNIRSGGNTQLSGAIRAAVLLALVLGPGQVRGGHSARGSCRYPGEGGLGHHGLAIRDPPPPDAAGTSGSHADDLRADGIPGSGHGHRYRTDRGRHGQRPPPGAAGAGQRGVRSAAGPEFPLTGIGRRQGRPILRSGRPGIHAWAASR